MKKYLILLSLCTLLSCQEKKDKSAVLPDTLLTNKENSQAESSNSFQHFSINFPDTIALKTWTDGELVYFFNNDSLHISKRYIFFHILINKNKEVIDLKSINEIKGQLVFADTLSDNENKIIHFESGSDYLGKNYLHGVIEDIRLVDNPNEDSLLKVKREITITKPVFVVERGS